MFQKFQKRRKGKHGLANVHIHPEMFCKKRKDKECSSSYLKNRSPLNLFHSVVSSCSRSRHVLCDADIFSFSVFFPVISYFLSNCFHSETFQRFGPEYGDPNTGLLHTVICSLCFLSVCAETQEQPHSFLHFFPSSHTLI